MTRRLRHLPPLLALTLLVSACAAGPAYTVAATRCDPAQHQALVGRNIGETFLPPALRVREISPGQMVTQDYDPARLNIFMDVKGWIGRVSCG
jgi:hypothetical protein